MKTSHPAQDNRTSRPNNEAQQPLQPADDSVILRLVQQLQSENERILELVERQRKLRLELLRAQEQKLVELSRHRG